MSGFEGCTIILPMRPVPSSPMCFQVSPPSIDFQTPFPMETFERYPQLGPLLPAMGYGDAQLHDLQETIDAAAAHKVEAIAIGTPIDLARLIRIDLPHTRVHYDLELTGGVTMAELLEPILHAQHAATV